MTKLTDKIQHFSPCREASNWLAQQPSAKAAWDSCHRGDWMLWLLGKLSGPPDSKSRKKLVLCACACARTSLKYVKPGEERPLKAIETAERWANEDPQVSLNDVRSAAADAAYAAWAAADAAYAADAAAAADAAYAAADAKSPTRAAVIQQCADIVRQHYPNAPRITKGN